MDSTNTPKPVPKTGDYDTPLLWLGMLIMGLISGIIVKRYFYK